MSKKESLIQKCREKKAHMAILNVAKFIFDSRNALGELGKNNPMVERV